MADAATLFNVFQRKHSFQSEKNLCNAIEDNIEDFCKDYLGVELGSYIREYRIGETDILRLRFVRPRADFLIVAKNGQRIALECKNAGRLQDNAQGITQLLIYKEHENFDRLIFITSTFSPAINNIIDRYKLPIETIYFNPTSIAHIPVV